MFLDRWVFLFQPFDLGPWTIKFWEGGVVAVDPVDIPGIDTTDRHTQLVVLAVRLRPAYLLVVAVRRSSFGQRLLAMKDSPAACATLGIDITRLKLSVFALSAAMAGVGGALYAGTLGSVSAERFSLFQSLPLLLLTVVGGIGTAAGPLFAGLAPRRLPDRSSPRGPGSATSTACSPAPWASPSAATPTAPSATSGTATPCSARCRSPWPAWSRRWSWSAALAVAGVITGWGLVFGAVAALVVWPQVAEAIVRRRAPAEPTSLERAGIDWPLTADEVRELDAALGLAADPEEAGAGRDEHARGRRRQRQLRRATGARRGRPHGRGRDGHGPDRSQRGRQDDAVQRHLRPPAAHARSGAHRWRRRHEARALQAGAPRVWAARSSASSPSGCSPCARTSAWPPTPPGAPHPDQVADELLERLGITDLGGQRADRLPTGQARVVELARALATAPKVLLLDEPASGQDEHETAAFSAVVREVAAEGVAVVLVEHDIQLVMDVCSQIHVLDLGRVLASGTPAEVQRDEAVLAAYLGAAPMSVLLSLRDLRAGYGPIEVLHGIDLDVPDGLGRRGPRAQRRRQDDPAVGASPGCTPPAAAASSWPVAG